MTFVKPLILAAIVLNFLSSLSAQTTVRVKDGDSLWTISKRTGVSIDAIREANNLQGDVIWEGATLTIPAPQPKVPTKALPVVVGEPVPVIPPTVPASPSKRNSILQLQVTLDRAGFSPGKIDGLNGKFTQLAKTLCAKWNPEALQANLSPTRYAQLPASWSQYVNPDLPGSGRSPDFKALTKAPQVILYYSKLEYLAERFHCSESLLKKLNPGVDLEALPVGGQLAVPNVEAFEIEKYFNAKGQGIWSDLLGKGDASRTIYISANDLMLTLWSGSRLIRAYPITLNKKDSPRGERPLGIISPGPTYMRLKTELELMPGPNSPVGIVWCPLGDGFGIHGTSNPDSIGRATSSGCIRLANWDAVRLAGLIRKGGRVIISEREQSYSPN